MCLGAGSNRRPLPLQGNALPTELPKHDYMILRRTNSALMPFSERTRHCTCFLIYFNQIALVVLLLALVQFECFLD